MSAQLSRLIGLNVRTMPAGTEMQVSNDAGELVGHVMRDGEAVQSGSVLYMTEKDYGDMCEAAGVVREA